VILVLSLAAGICEYFCKYAHYRAILTIGTVFRLEWDINIGRTFAIDVYLAQMAAKHF
jgi:hypothetical protein